MSAPCCLWCSQPFRPRVTGGRPQKFCSPRCRVEFFDAARAWAVAEVEAGRLTAAELARGPKGNVHVAEASETDTARTSAPAGGS